MDENIKIPTEVFEPLLLAYSILNPSFLLKAGKYLDTSKETNKSYFNDEKNQRIYNYIFRFFNKYKKVPTKQTLLAIIDRLERDDEIKLLMTSVAEKIYQFTIDDLDVDYIEEEALNFIKEAKVYEAIISSQEDIENKNFGAIVRKVEDAVRINFDKDLGISIKDAEKGFSMIDKLNKEVKISTGFQHFDNIVDEGLHPKEIICIAGVPGTGKTLFLGNMAINMFLQGKNVIVYTFETSTERLLMRYYTNLTGMSKKNIIMDEDEVKEKITTNFGPLKGNVILKEYNANSVSSNELMAHINDLMMYNGFKPDIIFVDYILIMQANDKSLSSDNSYKYYKIVTEELRNIAKTLYIPVVTAAQINRSGMSDRGGSKALVTAKDISESRGIYDSVDIFITIAQTAADKAKNRLYLYFDKNRNDRTGVRIEYEVDYEHMRLTEKSIVSG